MFWRFLWFFATEGPTIGFLGFFAMEFVALYKHSKGNIDSAYRWFCFGALPFAVICIVATIAEIIMVN